VNKIFNFLKLTDWGVELEQTLFRLALVLLGVIYAAVLVESGSLDYKYNSPIFIIGYIYTLFSALVCIHVFLIPAGSRWRHTIHMSLDVVVISMMMHSFKEYGIPFFAEYLWLIVGNGFRYGYKEAIFCTLISITSFIFVVITTAFWKDEILLTITCVILLTVIPSYVSIMLKRLQYEMQRAESANNEKSRFLANISHELRTPLNAIVGFSGLIDKMPEESEKSRLIKRIQDASVSLLALVDDVLDFSRIETGHMELVNENINIYSLVFSVQGMFETQAMQKGIELAVTISPSVAPFMTGDEKRLRQVLVNLVGNAVKFTQNGKVSVRLDNSKMDCCHALQVEVIDTGEGIPVNAQKYIFDRFRQADDSVSRRHGGAGLGTSIAKHLVELMGGEIDLESEPGRGSRFWFRIPCEKPPHTHGIVLNFPVNTVIVLVTEDVRCKKRILRLLDEISISNTTIKTLSSRDMDNYTSGGGMAHCYIADCASLNDDAISGLPVRHWNNDSCYIALAGEAHDRYMLLDSGYEQVSYSLCELRNSLFYVASKLGTCMISDGSNTWHSPSHSKEGRRILIAEDSDMNRQVFKGILEYLGLVVVFANSGIEALKRLKEDVFDLFIVDIQMPGMSGFEVITRYKSLYPEDARIPIVVVTGDVTREVQDECIELGVDRFLSKPVESEKMRKVVTELLSCRQTIRL
jgi:two-component system, sensor histidine kinase RpfC